MVLEQADYEQVYSDTWWRKLKQGTGVKGIFWDPTARGGVGDIAIRPMNLLMLYWEPGVMDIQDSPNFFSLSICRYSPGCLDRVSVRFYNFCRGRGLCSARKPELV